MRQAGRSARSARRLSHKRDHSVGRTIMLELIVPGKPNMQAMDEPDLTLQPLLAAAAAGEPLEPIMEAIVRGFGFESFMYAMTTEPRPHHDSRSYVWTTLPREWIAEYDKNAYVEIDPRITLTWGRTTPLIWDAATIGGDARGAPFSQPRRTLWNPQRCRGRIQRPHSCTIRCGIQFTDQPCRSIAPTSDKRLSGPLDGVNRRVS